MKKVLSVALASAMVLGMGANAFAISYSTGSNDKADWPDNFKFDGELFVTNKDGDIVEEASTALNDSESVNFEPETLSGCLCTLMISSYTMLTTNQVLMLSMQ